MTTRWVKMNDEYLEIFEQFKDKVKSEMTLLTDSLNRIPTSDRSLRAAFDDVVTQCKDGQYTEKNTAIMLQMLARSTTLFIAQTVITEGQYIHDEHMKNDEYIEDGMKSLTFAFSRRFKEWK